MIWNNYYLHYKIQEQISISIINIIRVINPLKNYYSNKYISKKIVKSYHLKKEEEAESKKYRIINKILKSINKIISSIEYFTIKLLTHD